MIGIIVEGENGEPEYYLKKHIEFNVFIDERNQEVKIKLNFL